MRAQVKFYLLGLSFAVVLSGCVVRSYPVTRDRVDQDLSGNRGYLKGDMPADEMKDRKATRTTQVVEVEFYPPVRFEKKPKTKAMTAGSVDKASAADKEVWGNRGYIMETTSPDIAEPVSMAKSEKYTVQKGDTLQKISQKFYGTTKRWNKIFEANSDKLKAPNKIYPGQVIDIPVESMKEPAANLK
ncbi:MAG: LysM peptidoglycan-binding domain-containing protein [Candidatus Omnitrophota bacterium]|jgi:nucleoid-associated protein YgaU